MKRKSKVDQLEAIIEQANYYKLLLYRLDGVKTYHRNCRVAKYIGELESTNRDLRHILRLAAQYMAEIAT